MTENKKKTSCSATVALPEVEPGTTLIPIATLSLTASPRSLSENSEHIRTLAESDADLPPIIVRRGTNRVIDGRHRVRAAEMRGEETIAARYFAGSDQEAFVLAIEANIKHGLPLPQADRRAAARRILRDHPSWSNRTVARIAGLSAGTIATIRKDSGEIDPTFRVGKDGRVRPLNASIGRQRAGEFLKHNPNASLREISAASGISVGTARDVRNRFQQSTTQDPSAADESPTQPQPTPITTESDLKVPLGCGQQGQDPSSALRMLRNDPSLRHSESGRLILRLLATAEMNTQSRERLIAGIPDHCVEAVVHLAAANASMWQRFVSKLGERRTAVSA